MKLREIEEALIQGNCAPDMLDQFKAALRRAPTNMRPQHCYTVAAQMPQRCFPTAIELIEYGLTLEGTWLDQMRAYANLAGLYEKRADYQYAKTYYQLALDTVEADRRSTYAPDFAARMLVCQLHMDGFSYSDEVRRLYEEAQKLNDFSRSFQKNLFYCALAEIILSRRDGDLPAAREACVRARAMLRPDFEGPLTALLRRNHYTESTGAIREARAFLRRCARKLRS